MSIHSSLTRPSNSTFRIILGIERTDYRAVIKFFVLKGSSTTEIQTKILSVLKESDPSFSTKHPWALEFERSRTSVEVFFGPSK